MKTGYNLKIDYRRFIPAFLRGAKKSEGTVEDRLEQGDVKLDYKPEHLVPLQTILDLYRSIPEVPLLGCQMKANGKDYNALKQLEENGDVILSDNNDCIISRGVIRKGYCYQLTEKGVNTIVDLFKEGKLVKNGY
ncbi:MAG: hypothetical protein Q8O89_05800 [Nanoarchaeota archaeon]|nr:hypothetical protein [Nanoarchaeota archaeon]